MKTYLAKKFEIDRKWYLIDAKDKVLGRLATRVATILKGKNKVFYTPYIDTGDFVIVTNCEKVRLTGRKLSDKMYYTHSEYRGGLKEINAEKLLAKKPEELLKQAVKTMLPRNKIRKRLIQKLKIYKGSEHPHKSQNPEII